MIITILILASAGKAVSLDFNLELELSGGGGLVLEDGDPFLAVLVLADTKVDRSPVTDVLALGSPLAGFFRLHTLGVDIVLSRGWHVLPLEVLEGIWAGQGILGTGRREEWDDLRFGAFKRVSIVFVMKMGLKRKKTYQDNRYGRRKQHRPWYS